MEGVGAGLSKRSWAKISQIRTLSVQRLGSKLGEATAEEVASILEGLNERLEVVGICCLNAHSEPPAGFGSNRNACPPGGVSVVEGAADGASAFVEHVRINHGGADIAVAEQLLDGADVVAVF